VIFQARYALNPGSELISNAALEVRGDRVVSLRSGGSSCTSAAADLGDVLLLPGLINAHTHLELTGLHGRVPFAGQFASWAERVIEMAPGNQGEAPARRWICEGARMSLRAGVTAVGDIGYGAHQSDELAAVSLRSVCYREILGIGPKHEEALAFLHRGCRDMVSAPPNHWIGLSPHAPYSTDPQVYEEALALAERRGWPVCTHLAETREETVFLKTGEGPLRALLERRGLVTDSFAPAGCTPIQFAERVGLLESNALLVHVNYLTDEELELLAGSSCSVAYCPRSHAFFGHEPHRFREMMAAGVNVCLGTDSLASNDSLSILDEWRFLHARYPDLDLPFLLRMSTVNAAAALGVEADIGSLEPGKLADFICLPADGLSPRDVMEQILTDPVEPQAVYVGGREVSA
jgi:cytosine/adenosine deaminase-related metal-dependent hydrolase